MLRERERTKRASAIAVNEENEFAFAFSQLGRQFCSIFFPLLWAKIKRHNSFFFFKFYGTKINTILCQINGMGVAIAVGT